jgi:hypothetical protein
MATAANVVKFKRSAVAGKIPATTDLQLGELALNTYDGRIYLKKSVSGTETVVALQPLPTGGSNGYVLRTDGSGNLSWTNNAVATDRLVNGSYSAILDNAGTLTVDNLTVNAQTTVTTQNFVVTSIGNLLLSEDGQTLALPPGQDPITTENYNTVIIGANTGSWYFKSQGVLQLPPGGDIVDEFGATVLGGGGGGGGTSYGVRYDTPSQNLTKTQQANARANIGLDDATLYFYSYMFG